MGQGTVSQRCRKCGRGRGEQKGETEHTENGRERTLGGNAGREKRGGDNARPEHGWAMYVPFVEFQDVLRSNVVMGIAIKCLRTSCGVGVCGG